MNDQTVALLSYLLQIAGWSAPIFVMTMLLFRINIRNGIGIGSARILSGSMIIFIALLFNAFWQYHFGAPHGVLQIIGQIVVFIGIALSLDGTTNLLDDLISRQNAIPIRFERAKLRLLLIGVPGLVVFATVLIAMLRTASFETLVDCALYNANVSLVACIYFAMLVLVRTHKQANLRMEGWFFLAAGTLMLCDGIGRTLTIVWMFEPHRFIYVRFAVSLLLAAAGGITIALGIVGARRMAPLLLAKDGTDSVIHYKLNVQKRFLLLLIISVFVIGATGFVVLDLIQSGRRNIENAYFNEQRKVAESVSANMEGLNQSFLSMLSELSQERCVQDIRVDSLRVNFKKEFQVWKNIAYSITRTDEHGILRYTYPEAPGAAGTDISGQAHIKRFLATHDTIFTGIFNSIQGNRAFAMYVPVYARDRNGMGRHFAGGVAMLLDIDAYSVRAFRNTKIFTPNPLAAVNAYGKVIVASDNTHAGEWTGEYLRGLFPTLVNIDSLRSVAHRVALLSAPQYIKITDNASDATPQWLIAHPLLFAQKPWGVIILPVSNEQVYAVYSATVGKQMVLWGVFAIVLIGLMGAVVVIFYRWSRFLEEEVRHEFTVVREAEGRYAKLFNEAIVGIFQAAPDGMLLTANPSMAAMLGYRTPGEFIASDALRTTAEGGGTPWNEISKHEGESFIVALRKSDGSIIKALVHCKAIMTSDNRIQQYEGFVEDVTVRMSMEDALRSSEIRFRAIFEGGKDAVFLADAETGLIVDANKEAENLVRRTHAEIIGLHQSALHPPDVRDDVERMFKMHAEKLTGGTIMTEAITSDGVRVPIEISSSIIDLGDGKTVVQGIFRDIADRQRLEQQLLQAQKLEGIGTLAGGIAHDFNNLLAMILGSAELLRTHSAVYPTLKKYVDRIIEASERGASISRQLLIFSRPDQAELKKLCLSGIITELEELLKHFLPKSVTIDTHVQSGNDIIMADAGHLHQALLNLALNANDAMPDGGALTIREYPVRYEDVKLKFPQCEPGGYVAVSITDTGIGIDDAVKKKIFDPFFSTKERGKGTGLGLSIVHGIVKSHQGYIDVESVPRKGTTFTMYFPVLKTDAPLAGPVEKPADTGNHETILIVDDEETIRELLEEYLKGLGYTVFTAADGHQALDIYRRHTAAIDVVITDLGMPEMGGEELFSRLRGVNPAAKVMVSSGYLDNSTKDKLIGLGIKDVLTKPYRLELIQSAIDALME